jgi:hypothetical protein
MQTFSAKIEYIRNSMAALPGTSDFMKILRETPEKADQIVEIEKYFETEFLSLAMIFAKSNSKSITEYTSILQDIREVSDDTEYYKHFLFALYASNSLDDFRNFFNLFP